MRVLALVSDLMDRSRLSAALDDVVFVDAVEAEMLSDTDVLVVDLVRHANAIEIARHIRADVHIVAFGPHVETAQQIAAREAGANVVLARSQFFRDIRSATQRPVTDR